MNDIDQIEANTNNNYCPDDAFTNAPAEAFQGQDKPASASVFDQVAYENMTLAQKFQANKEAVFKKHNVDTSVKGPTVADAIASAASAKFTVHQDGSVTSNGGILGNEKDSMSMIEVLRDQAYARHNITD